MLLSDLNSMQLRMRNMHYTRISEFLYIKICTVIRISISSISISSFRTEAFHFGILFRVNRIAKNNY